MNEPIRVLQVLGKMDRGGAETMVMNLYRNIDRSKIQFDFIVHTKEKCAYDDEITNLGGNIFRMPNYNGKNHLKYVKSWNTFFREHPNYKIIHGHIRSTAAIYLKIAKKYKLVTIAHSHNTSSGTGFSAIAKNILQYPIRYTSDYLFACSKPAGEWLFGKEKCGNSNFYIINNAIDADKFTYNKEVKKITRKALNLEGKLVIGHVGRFHIQKNHEFLIDIFEDIQKRVNNSVLLLIGDGPLKDSIKISVEEKKLEDKVIFTGVRHDIPDLLQAMDIFLFPSIFEGLPVSLIEAQAAGLKIFVSDVVSEEVAITNNIEFISLNRSAKYWANHITTKSKGHIREDMSEEIVSAGYDIKENAKILEKFYIEHSEYTKK